MPASVAGSNLCKTIWLIILPIGIQDSNKPFWQLRIFLTPALILMSHPDNLLLVSALPEHLLCPLLVEGAAHASVGGLHGKDGRAADGPALPHALFDHSCIKAVLST